MDKVSRNAAELNSAESQEIIRNRFGAPVSLILAGMLWSRVLKESNPALYFRCILYIAVLWSWSVIQWYERAIQWRALKPRSYWVPTLHFKHWMGQWVMGQNGPNSGCHLAYIPLATRASLLAARVCGTIHWCRMLTTRHYIHTYIHTYIKFI